MAATTSAVAAPWAEPAGGNRQPQPANQLRRSLRAALSRRRRLQRSSGSLARQILNRRCKAGGASGCLAVIGCGSPPGWRPSRLQVSCPQRLCAQSPSRTAPLQYRPYTCVVVATINRGWRRGAVLWHVCASLIRKGRIHHDKRRRDVCAARGI